MSKLEIAKYDASYKEWIVELKNKYLSQRLKASVAVNTALIEFYWNLGKDISQKKTENTYGSNFYKQLSSDLCALLPNVKGLSATNLKYTKYFYDLFAETIENRPQLADDLFMLPWGHIRYIIDNCKSNSDKAVFFVHQVIENNWSRAVLLNFLDTDLFEREGKAISNYEKTLPKLQGELAQQITKDPYTFDFLTLSEEYRENELEEALVNNMTKFLLELGTGFSFMGKQYRITVGGDEFFIDLLFYNTKIHAYCVVELKTVAFKPEQLGQLGFYVSAVNHQLKSENDNPTIGILICKTKNNVVAKYSLETVNEPIGISEYQLAKIYPSDFKGSLPSIEEIEKNLENERKR